MNCKESYVWPELVAPSRGVRRQQASAATEKTFNNTQLIVKCRAIKAELSPKNLPRTREAKPVLIPAFYVAPHGCR
jgi:hypothetical protein